MVQPGFLENEDVKVWLDGVEPAWTLLSFDSYCQLGQPPSAPDACIQIGRAFDEDYCVQSPLVRNTIRLLKRCDEAGGLKLTATGNLARTVVSDFLVDFDWPNFEREHAFRLHKVINEPDLWPLHLVRLLAVQAKLLRKYKGRILVTKRGRNLLSEAGGHGLQELLFETLFWQVNLGYFDGFPLERWPQSDCGIALWSLSVSAHDWAAPKHLSRLATVPIIGVLRAEIWDDLGTPLFEHRILRPLVWFGLLEMRPSETQKSAYSIDHVYRKSRLFDRTIKFTVELEGVRNARH